VRRRNFISLVGGAAAWPLAARAQQAAMPVVGYLYIGSPDASANLLAAFQEGMSETGYIEGRNVAIEYRWARNESSRLRELAADLVQRQVAVIAVLANPAAAFAAKDATTTIPIVFSLGGDPVALGLVASLNRPGGNVTGVGSFNVELGAKRVELLSELVPGARHYALLVNPNYPGVESLIGDLRAATAVIGRQIEVFAAGSVQEIDTAFAALVQKRTDALLVSPGAPFNERREQLTALAARYMVPAIYASREFALAGGLITYGAVLTDEFRQAGIYVGRVLKGEKPADLPVMRAVKFECVVNRKAARSLGLEVPTSILLRADEVLE
jgi:putative tryptophan/tyrosine transport system substrate-binding protein